MKRLYTAGCIVSLLIINYFQKFSFGFREGHSTTLALSKFVEGVLSTFDKDEAVCVVLLDFSKAFDSVDREILLKKRVLWYKSKHVFIAKIIFN